jgi:hypothetical protein
MRDGLDAPTLELSAGDVERIRAFLDGQSPIKLAVWVRHEQQGVDGPLYDHHVVLGIDNRIWRDRDMRAVEQGMHFPWPQTPEPTWIDPYPLSEVEPLRSFGTVLWEQTTPGSDPLDYRFTHEPVTVTPEALAAFRNVMPAVAPQVVRVTATRSRLWKGESEIEDDTNLCVACHFDQLGPAPGPLQAVQDAARKAGIAHSGGTLERPGEPPPYATVLYDREAGT